MQKCSNLSVTTSGYLVKSLVYNLSRTVLIGSVQNKDDLLEYIQTKWDIDRENKVCKCQLGIEVYDINIEGKYIAPLPEEEPAPKNFYTFNVDAWHCRLYKWVFGKEAHKVHPTMCPYFWIMVLVFLTFPLVLIVKMFGKAGTEFMDACTTYGKRRKANKEMKFTKNVNAKFPTMSDLDCYLLLKSPKYKKYQYDLTWGMRQQLEDKAYNHKSKKQQEKYEAEHLQQLHNDSIRKIKSEQRIKKIEKQKVVKVKITELRESKTSKIIGILFVSAVSIFLIYIVSIVLFELYKWINWTWVGQGLLVVAVVCGAAFSTYLLFKYLISPCTKYIAHHIELGYDNISDRLNAISSKIKPKLPKLPHTEFKMYKFKRKLSIVFVFLFGWIGQLFHIIVRGFIYMIDFFKMGIDLIKSMYHKNCPRITWENDNK